MRFKKRHETLIYDSNKIKIMASTNTQLNQGCKIGNTTNRRSPKTFSGLNARIKTQKIAPSHYEMNTKTCLVDRPDNPA